MLFFDLLRLEGYIENIMREKIEPIVKRALKDYLTEERHRLGITQEVMANALVMAPRSYADIERGASNCGMLTTVLLIMSMDDSVEFLDELKKDIEETINKEEVYV